MNRKEWKAIWRLLCDYSKGRSDVMISLLFHGIIPGIRPFISVVLTGKLIDAVYNGADFETIAKYALIAVSVYGILSVIFGISEKVFNRTWSICLRYKMVLSTRRVWLWTMSIWRMPRFMMADRS